METITIAKVLGVYFMVSGIFITSHKKTLMAVLSDLFKHRAISFFIGVCLVFGGASLIFSGGRGTGTLSTFVGFMSWAILIKGILYIFFPEWLHSLVRSTARAFAPLGTLITLLGVYLVFFL